MKLLLMGVSGVGKSTVGAALAEALGAAFVDADDLHPAENIAAMAKGEPLTDAMRRPWLDRCGRVIAVQDKVVLGCSALKRSYRDRLRRDNPDLRVIYLLADQELAKSRMADRVGHFMPVDLLESQFATLEPPSPNEDAITVPATAPVDQIIETVRVQLAAQIGR